MAKKLVITESESDWPRIFVDDHEMTEVCRYQLEKDGMHCAKLTLTMDVTNSLKVEISL